MVLELEHLNVGERQQWLQSAIAPRPVGLVSTINKAGDINLAPFSFFNLFSANPPIAIFSPARRVRDNTEKHSLNNVDVLRNENAVAECVINIVTHDMLHRVNLTSAEYPDGTNEFLKSGLTMEPSTTVKPPMVKESKIKFECHVVEVKPLGYNAGAGNLVICNLLRMHVADSIIGADGCIDPFELDLVARLGHHWYCKTGSSDLFELQKPVARPAGVDQLPYQLKHGIVFTRDQLAQLANVSSIPKGRINTEPLVQQDAAVLLDKGNVTDAWKLLAG